MAQPYAVQVTMRVPWKGLLEEFSNVFHYDLDLLQRDDAAFNDLADKVVAEWRKVHSARIGFVRVRVHGPTNAGQAADQMRLVKDLTGFGTATAGAPLPPELGVVGQVYVGRGPKGGKQFLRKFIHSGDLAGGSGTTDHASGVTALTTAIKAPYLATLATLKNLTIQLNNAPICTPEGKHLPLDSTWTVLDYTASRQFRRRAKRRIPTPAA